MIFDLIKSFRYRKFIKIKENRIKNHKVFDPDNAQAHNDDSRKDTANFLDIKNKEIAKFIPEGVAIRYLKKTDLNKDGKIDYAIIYSYPTDDRRVYGGGYDQDFYLIIFISKNNKYYVQYHKNLCSSSLTIIKKVIVYKNMIIIEQFGIPASGGGSWGLIIYRYQ